MGKKGFSLIEITVVLAMLTILTGIVIVSYQSHFGKGAYVEAKHHLALVYQAQRSEFERAGKYSPDLKAIGAVPRGGLRYNVGADWGAAKKSATLHGSTHYPSSDKICPCCKKGKNYTDKDVYPNGCCMDHNPNKQTESCSDPNPCYGGEVTGPVETFIGKISGTKNQPLSDVSMAYGYQTSGNNDFMFYAWGCSITGFSEIHELDLWSIDDRRLIEHQKKGAYGE